MMWGNSNLWMCELTDDMLSIKDQDGDGKITQGVNADIWYQNISGIEKIDGVDYTCLLYTSYLTENGRQSTIKGMKSDF